MEPNISHADHADNRRQTTIQNKLQPVFLCEIIQPCCIPLRDLRYLRENNTQEYSSYLQRSHLCDLFVVFRYLFMCVFESVITLLFWKIRHLWIMTRYKYHLVASQVNQESLYHQKLYNYKINSLSLTCFQL